jgi:hypothetical protein
MILDVSNQGGNYVLLGGAAADESEVQFPIQVLASGHQIFMVSMSSRDATVHPDLAKCDMKYPDFDDRRFREIWFRIQYRCRTPYNQSWSVRRFPRSVGEYHEPGLATANQQSVYVSGMTMIDSGDALVVVGKSQASVRVVPTTTMAKVNVEDGTFEAENSSSRSVAYYSSGSDDDD